MAHLLWLSDSSLYSASLSSPYWYWCFPWLSSSSAITFFLNYLKCLAYLCGFIIQFFTWDIAVMKSKMYSHVEIAGFHIHTWEYYRLENVQHLRFYTGVHTQCWSVQSICSTCLWLTLLILMKPVRIYVVFQKIGQSPMDGMSVFRHNTVDLLKCNLPITQQHDHNHDVVWVIINRLCKV